MEIKIALSEPIKFGSENINELVFRKPKAKDFRQLKMPLSMGELLDLAGKLAGQPPSVIDELSVDDTKKVLEVVGNFL